MPNNFTPTNNKKLRQPDYNNFINSWNEPLNTNFNGIDYALGGVTYIGVTGITTPLITFQGAYDSSAPYAPLGIGSPSAPETASPSYIPYNIYIGGANYATGVLSANLNYQLPAGVKGQWTIFNNTSGNYTVTFSQVSGGSYVIEQGKRRSLVSDGNTITRADSPSDAQGASTSLTFNDNGTYGGSALRYNKTTGNFTLGPLMFNGAIDGSGNLTTTGNQPLVAGMILKKASDGSALGTIASGSGSNWVMTSGFTATLAVDIYAYPASASYAFVVNGYDNEYATKIIGGKTSGQSKGTWILAGSTAADFNLVSQDKDGNNLFTINGLGSVNITSRPSSAAWALNVTKPADTSGGGIYCNGGAFTSTVVLTYGAPIQCDASKSNVFSVILTGSGGGLNITNAQNGQTINILIKQDGAGNRTITWSGIVWPSGTAGVLSTAANATDLLVLTYINAQWYGTLINSFS